MDKELEFLSDVGALENSMQHDLAHKVAELVEVETKKGKLGPSPTVYKISKVAVLTALKLISRGETK